MTHSRYRHILVAVLTTILVVNYIDRLALGVMLQDIKLELHLSDTELGLISGFAFAIFNALAGIPIARWADRGNRVSIISIATAMWSIATALCGLAGSFTQLFALRIAVGIGEAGCMPPAHSLIADHFDRKERPRAVSRYLLGAPISVIIGYLLVGWVNQLIGWRLTFLVLGLPGIAIALLAAMTLREPRRRSASARQSALPDAPTAASLAATFRDLWRNRSFRELLLYYSVASLFGAAVMQWLPTYFIRYHHLGTGELGSMFALANGVAGFVGTLAGGELASRYGVDRPALQLKMMALFFLTFILIWPLIFLTRDTNSAFLFMGIAMLFGTAINGPVFAFVQSLVVPQARATSMAVMTLVAGLVGASFGPVLAGALSDLLQPHAGPDALRFALLALCPGYLWGAWHLYRASRTVDADLAQVEAEDRQAALARAGSGSVGCAAA